MRRLVPVQKRRICEPEASCGPDRRAMHLLRSLIERESPDSKAPGESNWICYQSTRRVDSIHRCESSLVFETHSGLPRARQKNEDAQPAGQVESVSILLADDHPNFPRLVQNLLRPPVEVVASVRHRHLHADSERHRCGPPTAGVWKHLKICFFNGPHRPRFHSCVLRDGRYRLRN